MKLMFIGADHEVTGSCHYLEAGGKHILVDYGMEQGVNVFENIPLPVDEAAAPFVCQGVPGTDLYDPCHGGPVQHHAP